MLRTSFAQKDVNASGRLSRTLRSFVTENSQGPRLVVDAQSYVFEVEEGTPPPRKIGKPPVTVAAIKPWIRSRGFAARGRNADSLAWAITRTINQFGTKRYRDKIKTGAITDVINDKLIAQLENEIADAALIEALASIDSALNIGRA
jgi:hypothetical protein